MGHAATPEELKKHLRVYIAVFAALAVLTVVTVAISYLDLDFKKAVAVALLVATVKAGLVALYFMHLVSEKAIIFAILGLTAFFFAVLLVLPVLSV
jgi:cytochrome c oxidase subunit 4